MFEHVLYNKYHQPKGFQGLGFKVYGLGFSMYSGPKVVVWDALWALSVYHMATWTIWVIPWNMEP